MVTTNSVLQDRYRVEEKLATGGMGSVYVGTDEKLERQVAIKVLAESLAGDQNFVERFRREARAVAAIAHPKIANVFDYGEDDGCPFIVMELVEGRDLARVIKEDGPLGAERTAHIVSQICSALGHAHSAGIIHRDVKPANVIVGAADDVKVTDFGIARAVGDSKLTLTGSVLGTAHYISPEQASGLDLSPHSDLYSLGVVMFEMLTGAPPYEGGSLMSIAMRHVNERIPAPSTLHPEVPPTMDAIVLRATEKDPHARFRDANEMSAALGEAFDGELVGGVPPTTPMAATPLATTPLSVEPQTVWPIPGDRWDPTRLGRRVLIFFAVLAAIALLLLVSRLAGTEDGPLQERDANTAGSRRDPGRESTQQPLQPVIAEVGPDIIGSNLDRVQSVLEKKDIPYEVTYLGGEQLLEYLELTGVSFEDAEPGEIVGTDPEPEGSIREGQTITLFVSEGVDTEDPDSDKPPKNEGKGKGHGKNDEKDDD